MLSSEHVAKFGCDSRSVTASTRQ